MTQSVNIDQSNDDPRVAAGFSHADVVSLTNAEERRVGDSEVSPSKVEYERDSAILHEIKAMPEYIKEEQREQRNK